MLSLSIIKNDQRHGEDISTENGILSNRIKAWKIINLRLWKRKKNTHNILILWTSDFSNKEERT